MPQYPKHIKRLIRQYADRAYEAELALALGQLEQRFAAWHAGAIGAGELSDEIYTFTRGPARELWNRYRSDLDDLQVAHAIVTGLLKRDELPDELLSHLQGTISFFEQQIADQADAE